MVLALPLLPASDIPTGICVIAKLAEQMQEANRKPFESFLQYIRREWEPSE
jgi:hypothetical protein